MQLLVDTLQTTREEHVQRQIDVVQKLSWWEGGKITSETDVKETAEA